MKQMMIILTLIICFYCGWTSKSYFINKKEEVKLQEELINIYKIIEANNSTQYIILDNYGRLLHYVAGHDFRNSVIGCTECGLLSNLNKRKQILSDEIQFLSDSLMAKPDLLKQEELSKLMLELSLVDQHIYLSDERSKEISVKMFKRE